jgi:hypothetical protein
MLTNNEAEHKCTSTPELVMDVITSGNWCSRLRAQGLYAISIDCLPQSEEQVMVVFRSCDAVGRVLLNDV